MKKYSLLIAAVVIVLIIGIPYALGYRIGPNLKIERVGTLVLTGLPANTNVYVDQSLLGTTASSTKTTSMHDELVGGSHSVIVSVPGDYPWSTLASITSSKTETLDPILVSMTPHAIVLSGSDRDTALKAIASTTLPSISNPLRLDSGCAVVYVSNNQVIADAATTTPGCVPPPYLCDSKNSCGPTIIFAPVSKLLLVARYPNRQDALVVQFDNILYAIALDPRSPQFFAPILTATAPIAGILSDGTIVIRNIDAVYKISL